MTENKRFKYYEHKGADYILENPNDDLDFIEMLGDCLDSEEIVDKLNKLYDENEQLKSEYKVLHTKYQDLKKFVENNFDEYLTQEKLNKQIIKLSDENEQLKSENQRLKQLNTSYIPIDINKALPIIAECRGITVEEYLEEIERIYKKG